MSYAGLAVYVNFIMEMNFPDVITCLVILRWNCPFHTSPKTPLGPFFVYGKVTKTNKHGIWSNAIKGFICSMGRDKS